MKSKTTPIIVALLIPAISVLLAVGLIYFKKKNMSGLDAFPYSAYMRSPGGLAGNRYVLDAKIDVQLAKRPDGRVVAVLTGADADSLAVFIPEKAAGSAVSANQRYEMVVSVGENGGITVESMEKF